MFVNPDEYDSGEGKNKVIANNRMRRFDSGDNNSGCGENGDDVGRS